MAREIDKLVVKFDGDAKEYIRELKRIQRETNKTADDVKKSMGGSTKAVNTNLKTVGKNLTKYVTLPLIALGGASVKTFADFDLALTRSTSIMGVTIQEMRELESAAIALSERTTSSATELAGAYFFLASAGKSAEQSIALLPKVEAFAAAGAFDLAQATDLLTDAQSALGLTTKDVTQDMLNLTRVSDVLVKANTLANASVEQFSISLTSRAGAALKNFNKDIEEGVAVLAAYADQGIKGALAGNELSRILTLLSKASRNNKEQFEAFGFSVFDTNGKMRNMADIIANLEQVTEGMTQEARSAALEMLGFEARVQNAILPLLGLSDQIKEYEDSLRNATGVTDEIAKKQLKAFSSQMKILRNQVTNVLIGIGKGLAPAMDALGEAVKGVLGIFDSFPDSVRTTIRTLAVLLGLVGPLILAIAALKVALVSFSAFVAANPILASVAAVVALGVAVHSLVGELTGFNDELKRSEVLAGKIESMQQKRTAGIVSDLREIDDLRQRRIETEKALENQLKNVLGAESGVSKARKDVENRTSGPADIFVRAPEKLELDAALQNLKLQKDRYDELLKVRKEIVKEQKKVAESNKLELEQVEKLTANQIKSQESFYLTRKELQKQIKILRVGEESTFIIKNNLQFATDEQKTQIFQLLRIKKELEDQKELQRKQAQLERDRIKDLKRQAEEIKKLNRTPKQILTDEFTRLNMILKQGFITFDDYNKAADRAVDEFNQLSRQIDKATASILRFNAAEAGSAEGLQRIQEFRDSLKIDRENFSQQGIGRKEQLTLGRRPISPQAEAERKEFIRLLQVPFDQVQIIARNALLDAPAFPKFGVEPSTSPLGLPRRGIDDPVTPAIPFNRPTPVGNNLQSRLQQEKVQQEQRKLLEKIAKTLESIESRTTATTFSPSGLT